MNMPWRGKLNGCVDWSILLRGVPKYLKWRWQPLNIPISEASMRYAVALVTLQY